MTDAFVIAHAGHWALNLLYTMPLLVVVGIIVRDRLRERRRGDEDEPAEDPVQPVGP